MEIIKKIGPVLYENFKNSLRDNLHIPKTVTEKIKLPIVRLHQIFCENFVFIHINKCAGTSIERSLGIPFLNHDTLKERMKYIGTERVAGRFKFTFVRNPYDRMISLYFYRHRMDSLDDFCLEKKRFNVWMKSICNKEHLPKMEMPQVEWLKTTDGVIDMDFIGYFESLVKDYNFIKKRLNLSGDLVHIKGAIRPKDFSNMSFYNSDVRDMVTQVYSADFEHLGYEK